MVIQIQLSDDVASLFAVKLYKDIENVLLRHKTEFLEGLSNFFLYTKGRFVNPHILYENMLCVLLKFNSLFYTLLQLKKSALSLDPLSKKTWEGKKKHITKEHAIVPLEIHAVS